MMENRKRWVGDCFSMFRKSSVELGMLLSQPQANTVTGDRARLAAEGTQMSARQRMAVRHYSADGERGYYKEINRYFRAIGTGKLAEPLEPRAKRMLMALDMLLAKCKGLKNPVRLYRGIKSEKVAENIFNARMYHDDGFTSASTDLAVAMAYAEKGGTILVIDLPEGYPAIAIERLSRKPQEREVLMPRGVDLEMYNFEVKMGFRIFYVRP